MTAAWIAGAVVLGGAALLRVTRPLVDGASSAAGRRLRAPARLRQALVSAAVAMPADDTWTAWVVVGAAAVGLGLLVGGVGLAAVALATAAGVPTAVLAAASGRSERLVDAALPDVLDGVARSLRTGATLAQALAEAAARASGRLAADLGAVVHDASGGRPLVDAVAAWAARCPTPGVRLAVAAMALATESGGAPARAIDGVAATLRADLAVAGELRAQSSQARLSGLVIALAPLAFGLLAIATDPRTAAFLLRTPVGLTCLALGLALDGVAAWWMQRITAGVA